MGQRSKILIVDDEPFNVDLLEQELEDLGYQTVSAGDGQEALDKVAAEAPDLILLDVMLPVMDGITVCRILKDSEETRLIPIVMMTALNAVEHRIKGIEAGADDYLSKPLNERELVARIQTALRLKHTVDRKIGDLRSARDHFAKFVPKAVKRLVALNPDAPELSKREQDVSALFLDISGYVRLSESLPQDVLNTMIERYFSSFLDRIHHVGGEISGTAGDGLMAIFAESVPLFQEATLQNHAMRAVETALALKLATEEINRDNDIQQIAVHMGINSGIALVGSSRYEGQRGVRWTFTADGPVTNLAARLEGIAEAGQILVGPETVRRLEGRYPLRKLGVERLRNMAEPVDIHCVLAPPSPA